MDGHPSSVNGSLIKKHIKGASKASVGVGSVVADWPKEAKHARSAFMAGKLAKALEEPRSSPKSGAARPTSKR